MIAFSAKFCSERFKACNIVSCKKVGLLKICMIHCKSSTAMKKLPKACSEISYCGPNNYVRATVAENLVYWW